MSFRCSRSAATADGGKAGGELGALIMKLDSLLFLASAEAGSPEKIKPRLEEARSALGELLSTCRRLEPSTAQVRTGPVSRSGPGRAGRLTPKEKEIVVLISQGLADKEMARKLGVSVNTIHAHRNNIARKLDIHKQTDLVRFAIKERLVRI
jgi:DNA-binding NarL/FixJ family response regulator